MDDTIGISTAIGGKTKEDLIQQAHQARQARELTRRRERAAITIQAFYRMATARKSLKQKTRHDLDKLINKSKAFGEIELLFLLKRMMFFCDPQKDRNCFDSLLEYILNSSRSTSVSADGNNDSAENVDFEILDREDLTKQNFFGILLLGLSHCESSWTKLLEKLLNLCLDYIKDATSARLDSQHIDTYLKIIDLFTTKELLIDITDPMTVRRLGDDKTEILFDKISTELLTQTLLKRKSFFRNITTLVCEKVGRFRNDLKSSILSSYIRIIVSKLLRLGNPPQLERLSNLGCAERKESASILLKVLSAPGSIHMLEKHSPESIKNLPLLTLSINLIIDEQEYQKLNSSSAVCLLANLIHLASIDEEAFGRETIAFVTLITKILETCQKNMLIVSSAITSGTPKLSAGVQTGPGKKKNESVDVTFNPVLGWLVREQATNLDREVLKSQLSHLWSKKFLSILLKDLKLEYDRIIALEKQGGKAYSTIASTKPRMASLPSKEISNNQSSFNNVTNDSTINLIRRFAERAASTMSRTIYQYPKTTGSTGTGSSKLTTPETNRIALVCLMLHQTLKTLTTLKQDILTGLCMHDYLLSNLWTFIRSLGPNNGLRAFLEHLAIYTKTSAAEFHILTLFCECASHIISILDDSELYEKQQPFKIDDLIAISSFLNNFVFRTLSNNLIPQSTPSMDPILQTTHRLLSDLYKRDCRRRFSPKDHWLIKDIKMSVFLKDLEAGKPVAKTIMSMLPHIIPHRERVLIFRRLVTKDKAQYCNGPSTLITIHRSRIVEDGYQQLIRLPNHALKGLIRVKFINDHGLDEAGIDQDGVFKEFLEDTIKRVFDPALNLFCSTSEQRLYPSPTSRMHEDYLSLFNFVGKMLAKAVYEGIVVDVPFATFFLSRLLGQPQSYLYSPIDELPSLDPELYKSLTYIKHYEGDVSELDLTFSIDQDFMGKIETYELETGGKSIPVTRESRVRYIHSVANFRMKTQIEKQTEAFVNGFKSIINLDWLSMFSASEFQRLVSGDNSPIDLQDLRRHTKYFGGFHNNHRVVCWLWDVMEKDFTAEEHKMFLKFVTSCSKPPLLGFANLEPPFTIRCVEVSDDQDPGDTVGSVLRGFFAIRRSDPVDRLPTSSTCFNLLKLPNYQRRSTLREKLRYAIRSSPGFELS